MSKTIKINTSPIVLLYALEGVLWNLESKGHIEHAEYWIQFLQQLRMEMQAAAVVHEPVVDHKKRKMSDLKRKRLSAAMKKHWKAKRAAQASEHTSRVQAADKKKKVRNA